MRTISPSQIETLLDAYYLPLFRFAERLCGSPTRAMLLTQRTFKQAVERTRHNLPVPGSLRAWLVTILFHNFLETGPRLNQN
jgi:DNA-directed RNA polymerase specialized sigma24 family protein